MHRKADLGAHLRFDPRRSGDLLGLRSLLRMRAGLLLLRLLGLIDLLRNMRSAPCDAQKANKACSDHHASQSTCKAARLRLRTGFWRASCRDGLDRVPCHARVPSPDPCPDPYPCPASEARWGCLPAAAARPCLCRGGRLSTPGHSRGCHRAQNHGDRVRCATCRGRARICCCLYWTYWEPWGVSAADPSNKPCPALFC